MAEKLTPQETAVIEAALEAFSTVDTLMTEADGALRKVSPAELYAYANDPGFQPQEDFRRRLEASDGANVDLQRMIENTSRFHMPQMAAASSGDIDSREVAGCKIVFRPSRADPEQLYAIIEITDPEISPRMLFVRQADGQMDRIELPEFQAGRAQLLLERHSAEARGLMDINTEVFVK